MAQWFRILAVHTEDMGLVPNTHMMAQTVHNSNLRGPDSLSWSLRKPGIHVVCIHTQR